MPRIIKISLLLLLAALPCSDAAAQGGLSDEAQVSLITVLPGVDVYALWGHSAIRVYDPLNGVDVTYNYGTFDFEDDWFVLRFMYGNLRYRLARHDFDLALEHYRVVEERSVIEQVLTLTSAQRDSLIRFLEINYLPENRYYAYDFLFDNCSTRIRDAFEDALDGAVQWADEPDPGATFRELLDPYQSEWPFLDPGIDWLLGAPVDRIAEPYQTMFLPIYLMEAFDRASVQVDGEPRPLVASTDTLVWLEDDRVEAAGFPWEIAAAWLLFLMGAVLTIRSKRPVLRAFDGVLFTVVGVAGVLITFLWFISLHDVTEKNWHLLWTWPTHVVAGIVLTRRRDFVPLWLRRYLLVAAIMALVALVGAPIWPQAFNAVHFPVMLLLALRSSWIFVRSRELQV